MWCAGIADWLQFDSRTEIPGTGLFGPSTRRLTPHIYESREIEALLSAAARLRCTKGVRGATYATLFGLLAATGLRLPEALSLQRGDVDLTNSSLTLKKTKFARSRVVPLHPSTTRAFTNYASVRDRAIPAPLQAEMFFSPHEASNSTVAQSNTRLPDYESSSVGKHAATTLLPASTI
jgi:integrase